VKIALVSKDANFVAAATGLAGPWGTRLWPELAKGSLTVVDAALPIVDSLATVVFAPVGGGVAALASSAGAMCIHPRRRLPVELPRSIALYATE
jgi:hypothetical protein